MTRILALDHGAKRIGVAIGESETRMAFDRPALRRTNLAADVAEVGRLCAAEGIQQIVVGLPLNLDGSEGAEAARARAFGDQLAVIGMPIAYLDERLTSWEAGRRLRASGRTPERGSGELDSTAARLILQEYLDAQPVTGGADVHSAEETE